MNKRIIISATSDLTTDQRVLKVAQTCHTNDFRVLLIGRLLQNSSSIKLPFEVKRMKLIFNKSFLFYAEYNIRLFLLLLCRKSDILLSNDTDTIIPNYLISLIKHSKLIFDAHELFPEVPELHDRKFVKSIWQKIEKTIFPKITHAYTVSQSIADYYNRKYGMHMRVIRNVPYLKLPMAKTENDYKIILYQGALNVGRGLEQIIDAMPFIDPKAQLTIIGDGDIKHLLQKKVSDLRLEKRVNFLGKIQASELHTYTQKADIGLCLLENIGLSYYFALPNRIFDFMHAGVPVLASNFPEIASIVSTYRTGVLIDNLDVNHIATTVNKMIAEPLTTIQFEETARRFCWEEEEKILLEILNQ